MKDGTFVFYQEGCGGCDELRRSHPELPFVNIDKGAASKLADKLGIRYVPAMVRIKDGKVCLLDSDMRTVKCVRKKGH